jgi:hypothetical protein
MDNPEKLATWGTKKNKTKAQHTTHSQKSWVILLMNIHKPNRVM